MSSAPDTDTGSEETAIFSWRLDQLEHLGFGAAQAAVLAAGRSDVHDIRRAIEAGCDHHLAYSIFAD